MRLRVDILGHFHFVFLANSELFRSRIFMAEAAATAQTETAASLDQGYSTSASLPNPGHAWGYGFDYGQTYGH